MKISAKFMLVRGEKALEAHGSSVLAARFPEVHRTLSEGGGFGRAFAILCSHSNLSYVDLG